jgi:hypothetical protein
MKQLSTVLGELDSAVTSEGIVPVVSVRLYRHACDHIDGNQDSWFLEVTARLRGCKGSTIHTTFVHKSMLMHGKPKALVCSFASEVLLNGKVNLLYWNHCA